MNKKSRKTIEIEGGSGRLSLKITKESDGVVVLEAITENGKRDAMIALYPDEVGTVAEALLEMIE